MYPFNFVKINFLCVCVCALCVFVYFFFFGNIYREGCTVHVKDQKMFITEDGVI